MKTNLMRFCVVVLLTSPLVALGQKTEVSVQKGKVVAQSGSKAWPSSPAGKRSCCPANSRLSRLMTRWSTM